MTQKKRSESRSYTYFFLYNHRLETYCPSRIMVLYQMKNSLILSMLQTNLYFSLIDVLQTWRHFIMNSGLVWGSVFYYERWSGLRICILLWTVVWFEDLYFIMNGGLVWGSVFYYERWSGLRICISFDYSIFCLSRVMGHYHQKNIEVLHAY
jgi:hypothetical protein